MLDSLKRRFFYAKDQSFEMFSRPVDPDDMDEGRIQRTVFATVAELKDVSESKITNQTLLGEEADLTCLLLCQEFGRAIFVDDNTTVGELIAQLEEL